MRLAFAATAALVLMPRAALACPVCFGQSDSPMASAANWSIFAMLVITGGVLAGFAAFFIHLIRRAYAAGAEYGEQDAPGEESRLDRCAAQDFIGAAPHNGRAQSATAKERSGVFGAPRATEPGFGAEPRLIVDYGDTSRC